MRDNRLTVLLTARDLPFSWLTRQVTKSKFGHASVVIFKEQFYRLKPELVKRGFKNLDDVHLGLDKCDKIVLEASFKFGYHFAKYDLTQYSNHKTYELPKMLNDDWIINFYGTPYGFGEIFGIAFRIKFSTKGIDCSEAVFKAVSDALNLSNSSFEGYTITPRDIDLWCGGMVGVLKNEK